MSDLKMKINSIEELKLKMKTKDNISMKFDDYVEEKDPIYSKSPASTITYQDISNWNNKSNFSGDYNDLKNKPNLTIYATKNELNFGLSNKVDKVEGMGLSQNSFTTEEKNKLANLENYDDTGILEDISEINTALESKANISDIPTATSDLLNDNGFITNTVNDLTNYPTNSAVNSALGGKQNKIDSDNKLSADLVDDTSTTNKFVTASDITAWNNKSDFSGNYNDLTNKPTIPTKTSDLNNDSGFITNSVNNLTNYTLSSNLSSVATSGSYNDLSNKPTIPTAETLNVYSTTEQIVGTWMNKPLYRKIIENTTPSVSSDGTLVNKSVAINVSNVDFIYLDKAIVMGNSNYNANAVVSNMAFTYGIRFEVNANNIVIYCNSTTFGNLPVKMVIEYTKTTD